MTIKLLVSSFVLKRSKSRKLKASIQFHQAINQEQGAVSSKEGFKCSDLSILAVLPDYINTY